MSKLNLSEAFSVVQKMVGAYFSPELFKYSTQCNIYDFLNRFLNSCKKILFTCDLSVIFNTINVYASKKGVKNVYSR